MERMINRFFNSFQTKMMVVICLTFSLQLHAQKNEKSLTDTPPTKNSKSSFTKVFIGTVNQESITDYLLKQSNFRGNNININLTSFIESPYGKHYTYNQTYQGVDIYNSQIKINTNKNGSITSQFDNSYAVSTPLSTVFPTHNKVYDYLNTHKIKASDIEMIDIQQNYYELNNDFIPTLKADLLLYNKTSFQLIIDAQGQLLHQKDLAMHYQALPDSVVNALVFMPDPLTSANVTYGGSYIDNNDADVAQLNAQRVAVTMTVSYDTLTGIFSLESPFVKITEQSSPVTTPTTSLTNNFNFTRAQTEFEDVNAYYHLTTYQNYLQSLGFMNLVNYQINVDAHAFGGADNSNFLPTASPKQLNFGEGGVDDAEDSDVILHEYYHAIGHSAAPSTNSGSQREALDEANGDYVAASYSKSIDPFNYTDVYSWDGHNPFWSGRSVSTTKTYPANLTGNIYSDAPIWSSTIMEINGDIGRTQTDKILFQSIYSYATNMTMIDAARLFIQADSTIYGGANNAAICNRFYNRGFVNQFCNPLGVQDIAEVSNQPLLVNSIGFANGESAYLQLKKTTTVELQLFDAQGKLVWNKTPTTNKIEIPNRQLSTGIYLLKANIAGQFFTYKLVRR